MTPQQEQQLRLQARARGYDQSKENAYVEFVKNKTQSQIQASEPAPAPQKPAGDGFLKSLIKDPIKELLVRPAVRTAQAGIALFGGERGKQFAEQDQNVQLPLLGNFNIPAQKPGVAGAKQIAGDAAKSGSYLYAPGAAAGVAKTVPQAIGKSALQGAKAGAAGSGLYSAGQSLQENKSLGNVALDAAKGAAVGAVAGGVLAGSTSAAVIGGSKVVNAFQNSNPLTKRAVRQLEGTYDEIFTGTKAAKKAFDKSTARGKTPAKFLAEHGVIVGVKNGKIDANTAIEKVRQNAEPLENILDDILKTKDAALPEANRISLDIISRKAKQALNTEPNKASGNLSKMFQQVDDVVAELKNQFGDSVDLSTLNAIKRGQWAQTGFDATRPKFSSDVNYKIGSAAKNTLEEVIEEADIKELNRYLGDHLDAIKNLEKVNGNAVKGGRLGNYAARTLGAIVGAKAGPVGSIAGALGGDVVANIMQNNYIASPIKRMLLQRVMSETGMESPVYKAAAEALRKLKVGQSLMRLPAPKPGAPNQSINVPINQPSQITPLEKGVKTRIETNPARMLPQGSGTAPIDYTAAIKLPARIITNSAEESAKNLRRIGGQFSRRTSQNNGIGKKLSNINDILNEVTPGLSITNPKIKSLQTEWQRLQKAKLGVTDKTAITRYEKAQKAIEKQVRTVIKLGGVGLTAVAAKVGSSRAASSQPPAQ